jgi:hypothetical protein
LKEKLQQHTSRTHIPLGKNEIIRKLETRRLIKQMESDQQKKERVIRYHRNFETILIIPEREKRRREKVAS